MARVVFVHGIGARVSSEAPMSGQWLAAMNHGLTRVGTVRLSREEVAFARYADLFQSPGPRPTVDVSDREHDLLMRWWRGAARVDPDVVPPTAEMNSRTSMSVRMALHQLARSRFFAGVAAREDLRQMYRYFIEPELRQRIRDRVSALLAPETRVVVAHSLGSVVAYETLCATTEHRVRVFVTLGSPLGVPDLIFDRLDPAPKDGIGCWPGPPELVWTNIADRGDVVALAKDLRVRFGPEVRNILVDNGVHGHSAVPYLTDGLTGQMVAQGLIRHERPA